MEKAQQRQFQAAADVLQDLIQRSPQDYTLWFSLGNCYLNLQDYARAEGCFTTAIALQPEFILGYDHRGLARLGLQQYRDAVRDFDSVLQDRPDLCAARINRALAYQGMREPESAIQDLTWALARCDGDSGLLYSCASQVSARGYRGG